MPSVDVNPPCTWLLTQLQEQGTPWTPWVQHGLPSFARVFGHIRIPKLLVTAPRQVQEAASNHEVKQGAVIKPSAL